MAGFGFKTASVPFHFWCPDVYAGAADSGYGVSLGGPQSGRICDPGPVLFQRNVGGWNQSVVINERNQLAD